MPHLRTYVSVCGPGRHIPAMYANNWRRPHLQMHEPPGLRRRPHARRLRPTRFPMCRATSRLSQPSAHMHRRARVSAGAFLMHKASRRVHDNEPWTPARTLSLRECILHRRMPRTHRAQCVPSADNVPP
ncbi:hypothetical protein C8R44DRAFT_893601 [Mycena epipterygia]|nr:hypothetical protein C8R44DRAFT_893601 [Mycena epipterygia]